MSSMTRAAAPALSRSNGSRPLVQRKCACGNSTDHEQQCESCKQKDVQRKAAGGTRPAAPSIVHEVVGSGGRPLDTTTRTFFESRFGHDFGAVRIHDDTQAARSASAINADAYTVGNHVAFGQGGYAPGSRDGLRLLAHELTHVVQQSGGAGAGVQRSSLSSPVALGTEPDDERPSLEIGPENDALEREADEAADHVGGGGHGAARLSAAAMVQRKGTKKKASPPAIVPARHPAIVGLDEAGPGADLTGDKETLLFNCMKKAPANPDECDPSTALSWSDFTGSPKNNGFTGETFAPVTDVAMDPVRASCLQRILGRSKDETRVFQAKFDGTKSWGTTMIKNPSNTAATGCAARAKQCRTSFARGAANFTFSGKASKACPASPVAASVTASSAAGCTDIETECTNTAAIESARVLAHEQGHLDVSCEVAKKANTALALGTPLKTIKDAVNKKLQPLHNKYDSETNHGCKPTEQATWVSDIANHLPKVTIP